MAFRLHPKKDAGPSGWLPTSSLSGTASMRAMRVSGPDQKHLRHTRCGSKFGRAKPVSAYLTAQRREKGEATLAGKGEACLEQTTMGKFLVCHSLPRKDVAEEREETRIAALPIESGRRIQKGDAASGWIIGCGISCAENRSGYR